MLACALLPVAVGLLRTTPLLQICPAQTSGQQHCTNLNPALVEDAFTLAALQRGKGRCLLCFNMIYYILSLPLQLPLQLYYIIITIAFTALLHHYYNWLFWNISYHFFHYYNLQIVFSFTTIYSICYGGIL